MSHLIGSLHEVKAKLDNAGIVIIDQASPTKEIKNPERWEYLGRGTYYSVNGVPSTGLEKMHFWKKRGK